MTAPARRPWLLGAGVGIGLTMGLVLLLALFFAAVKARPTKRSGVRTTRPRPPEDAGPPATPTRPPAEGHAARPEPKIAASRQRAAAVPEQNGSAPSATHLVFVPTADGYRLVERTGAPPEPGTPVDGAELKVDGDFVVVRVGPSPLPLDQRRCVYLERSYA